MNTVFDHNPVMLQEVLNALTAPAFLETNKDRPFKLYIDATFGRGGYTNAVLDHIPNCKLIAFDQDPDAQAFSEKTAQDYPDRFHFAPVNFSLMEAYLDSNEVQSFKPSLGVDGILFDLGVSSPQLDDATRGFSFRHDGPLDMRMSKIGETAADFINTASEETIADTLYLYGDEKKSRQIARRIIEARNEKRFYTTFELKQVIYKVIKPSYKTKIDPATRSFQALRIHVNKELDVLESALLQSEKLLRPSGRLVAVSFHSLEDRIIKKFIQSCSTKPREDHFHLQLPTPIEKKFFPSLIKQSKKAILASPEEIQQNRRSRSAKMRVAERTENPLLQPGFLKEKERAIHV